MNTVEENASQKRDRWVRGLYMLLFAVFFNIAEALIFVLALFQFVVTLLNGRPNERLLQFGADLSRYVHDVSRFLAYDTESKPFPFSDWPGVSGDR